MISIWEAVQGVAFMVVLGLIIRGATVVRVLPRKTSAPSTEQAAIPAPREAAETQERAET